jgi:rubrerythrin
MIIATVAATLNLILLYGLDSALTRIEILENSLLRRKILKEDDFDFNYSEVNTTKKDELKKHGRIIEGNENITYCTECGYQLFPEDKFCPNCKAGKKNVTHKKDAK